MADADASGAKLTRSQLPEADLSRVDFRKADLRWANLSGASLVDADLRQADLYGADLTAADLTGAALPPDTKSNVHYARSHPMAEDLKCRLSVTIDAQQDGNHQIIVDTGREALLYAVSGCTITEVVDQQGAPFLFDIGHRRGTGDGVAAAT
jgi:pentapeptide repeat protein